MAIQQSLKFRRALLTTVTLLSIGLPIGSLLSGHAAVAQLASRSKQPTLLNPARAANNTTNTLNFGNNHSVKLLGYRWTVSNGGHTINSAGGAGAGKPISGEFTFTTTANASSADLTAMASSGASLPSLELISVNTKEQSTVTWKLTHVTVTSFQSSGSRGHATETFSVHFDRLDLTYASKLAQATTSWDYAKEQGSISTNGLKLSPKLIDNVLDLGNGQVIAIQDFSWNQSNSRAIENASTGAGAGKAQSGNFTFTTGLDASSVQLTSLVNTGRPLKTVIFSQTDAHGKLLNQWTLNNVAIITNQISATRNQTLDTFTLTAGEVIEKVFDQKGNVPNKGQQGDVPVRGFDRTTNIQK